MGVIANVQGIVIVNRSLDWTLYTDCSVTFVGGAYLHVYRVRAYLRIHIASYMLLVGVDFCYC